MDVYVFMTDEEKAAFCSWCAECCGVDIDKVVKLEDGLLFWQLYNRWIQENNIWGE